MTPLRKEGDLGMRKSYVDEPESMTISNCGKYVVLTTRSVKSASTVIKIPDEELVEMSDVAQPGISIEDVQGNSKELASIASMNVSAFNLRPGQVLKGSHLGLEIDGDSSRVLTIRADDTVNLDLSSAKLQKSLQSLRLISLPDLPGIEQTTAAVRIPRDGDHDILIFLNRNAQRVYYPSSEQGMERFPLVIERDPFSVVHTLMVDGSEKPCLQSQRREHN